MKRFFSGIVESIKRTFGYREALCLQTDSDGNQAYYQKLQKYRIWPDIPVKPLLVILSAKDNYWEEAALIHALLSLQEGLGNGKMPDIEVIFGNNDFSILQSKIVATVRAHGEKYGSIVTLSPWTTMAIAAEQSHRRTNYPHVFAGGSLVKELGLVNSIKFPGRAVTGVQMALPNYEEQVAVLKDMRPDAKEVLVPYNHTLISGPLTGVVQGLSDQFKVACDAHDIRVRPVGVCADEPVVEKIMAQVGPHSIITVPTDSTVLAHTEPLAEACNKKNVTMYAFDVMSVKRGAALGTGGSGSMYGASLGFLLYHIYEYGKKPGDLPIITLQETQEVRYNPDVLATQKIMPSEQMLRTMRMRSIYAGAD